MRISFTEKKMVLFKLRYKDYISLKAVLKNKHNVTKLNSGKSFCRSVWEGYCYKEL